MVLFSYIKKDQTSRKFGVETYTLYNIEEKYGREKYGL